MSKERYEREHEWIIDNNKRKTKEESIIVYDEEWNTLDDICELLNRQDKTIADLEAKLAEWESDSNATLNEYRAIKHENKQLKQKLTQYEKFMKDNEWDSIEEMQETLDKCEKKYCDIQEQLAEKDRQIEQLKKFDNLSRNFYDMLRIAFKMPNKVDDLFNSLKTMQEKQDQDKISFAVEQLEKVKEKVEKRNNGTKHGHSSVEYKDGYSGCCCQIRDFIDNQIKQLKEKNDE